VKPCRQRCSCFSSLALVLGSGFAFAQSSPVRMCTTTATPAWCKAVRGDRSEGWLPQTRSEVMARNGLVTTVQPLAAQAGLQVLEQGGNAIDAAVATAAAFEQDIGRIHHEVLEPWCLRSPGERGEIRLGACCAVRLTFIHDRSTRDGRETQHDGGAHHLEGQYSLVYTVLARVTCFCHLLTDVSTSFALRLP
jgi:hypothetical protein